MRARRRVQVDDAGMSLVEVLVAMALLMAVSSAITAAVVSVAGGLRSTDDEARGLGDVKTVAERLDRDVRDARGVLCDGAPLADGTPDPDCHSHLQVWIDYNSNYKLDSGETVTWKLAPLSDGHHFQVLRTVGTTSKVEATSLIVNFAFTYDTPPTNSFTTTRTRTVVTGMTYDAIYAQAAGSRTLNFTTRLRNVA